MTEEPKRSDGSESRYETEYALLKDVHYRKGEILRLEYLNAKHCREIEILNDRIHTILKAKSDMSCDLFEYTKDLIIELSHKEGSSVVNSDEINMKYAKSAIRYTMPGLFSVFALLSDDTKHKIELADSILHMFGVGTMAKYEELVMRGDIEIATIDRRIPETNQKVYKVRD